MAKDKKRNFLYVALIFIVLLIGAFFGTNFGDDILGRKKINTTQIKAYSFQKTIDNKTLKIIKGTSDLFEITSDKPDIYFVGDVKKTKEWGHKEKGYEIIIGKDLHIVNHNYVCTGNTTRNELIKGKVHSYSNENCIYYPPQIKCEKFKNTTLIKPIIKPTPLNEIIKYSYYTEHHIKKDGNNWVAIYPKPMFGYEDGVWKKKEDLRSFKGTIPISCIVKKEKGFEAECLDYNHTHVKIRVMASSDQSNKIIPIKIFKPELVLSDENELETVFVEKKIINVDFKSLPVDEENKKQATAWYELREGEKLHFGKTSTEIKLSGNETFILEDVSARDGDTTDNGGGSYINLGTYDNSPYVPYHSWMMMNDTSGINWSSNNINDATLYFYREKNYYSGSCVGGDWTLYTHEYDNNSWTEDNCADPDDAGCPPLAYVGSQITSQAWSTDTSVWRAINITAWVIQEWDTDGQSTLSIYQNTSVGSASGICIRQASSKDNSVTSRHAYLNITYVSDNSAPSTPTSIYCNGTSDCNVTVDTDDWDMNCSGSTDTENDEITYIIELGNTTGSTTNSSTETADGGVFTDNLGMTCDSLIDVNDYTDTQTNDGTEWRFGFYNGAGQEPIDFQISLEFNLSSLDIDGSDILNISLSIHSCWQGGSSDCGALDQPEFDANTEGEFRVWLMGADNELLDCINTVGSECEASDYIELGDFDSNPSWGNAYDENTFTWQKVGGFVDGDLVNDILNFTLRTNGTNYNANFEVEQRVDYVALTAVYTKGGTSWTEIGNHTNGTTLTWNATNYNDTTDWDLRCRAIDLAGSNTYSSYYTKNSYLNISITTAGNPDTNLTVWNGTDWVLTGGDYEPWFRCLENTNECEPLNQSAATNQCIFRVCNNGTASGSNVYINVNRTFTNITMFCDDDNTTVGATTLSTSNQSIHGALAVDACTDLCCWLNLTVPPSGYYYSTYTYVV